MEKQYEIKSGNVRLASTFYQVANSNRIAIILTGDSPNGTLSNTWPPLIEGLLGKRISVISFDFLSQGKSQGDRKNLNLTVGIQNFIDTVNFYFDNGLISRNDYLYAIGSSFGASVIINSKEFANNFHKLVFKSPALDLAMAYENEEGGAEKIAEWRNTGISSSGLSFNAYLEAKKYNPFENLEYLTQPILIIQGEDDEIVSYKLTKRFEELTVPGTSLIILKGVKHNYKQNNGLEFFIKHTLDFLSR